MLYSLYAISLFTAKKTKYGDHPLTVQILYFLQWLECSQMVKNARVQSLTQKMVLYSSLLSTQHYKVWSRLSSTLSYILV